MFINTFYKIEYPVFIHNYRWKFRTFRSKFVQVNPQKRECYAEKKKLNRTGFNAVINP